MIKCKKSEYWYLTASSFSITKVEDKWKEAIITYEFENLVIDIPRASGPGGKELGSAKWTINGKLIIKAY